MRRTDSIRHTKPTPTRAELARLSVLLDGGVTATSHLLNPQGVAVDSTSVYWTTEGNDGGSGTVVNLTPK